MDRSYSLTNKSGSSKSHYRQQSSAPRGTVPAGGAPCWAESSNLSHSANAYGGGQQQQISFRNTSATVSRARSSRKSKSEWQDYESGGGAYWPSKGGGESSNPPEASGNGSQFYVLPPPPLGFDHRPNAPRKSSSSNTPRKKKSLATSQPCLQDALEGSSYLDDDLRYFPPPPRGYYTDDFGVPASGTIHHQHHQHRPASSSSNYNNRQSRRASPFFLPRSESFSHHHGRQFTSQFVPGGSFGTPGPPPQVESSLSPLEVVRNKRASQAQWEKRNLIRASSVESVQLLGKPVSCSGGGSLSRKKSSLHRSSSSSRRQAPHYGQQLLGEDALLPPPPSPPCTCGKNLVLPPAPDYIQKNPPPPSGLHLGGKKPQTSHHLLHQHSHHHHGPHTSNQGFDSEASIICDHPTAQINTSSTSPRRKSQPESANSGSHLRNGHVVIPRMDNDEEDDDRNPLEDNIAKRVIIENGGFMSRPSSAKGFAKSIASSDCGDDDIESNNQFLTNGYRYIADEATMVRNAALVAGRRRSNAVQSCSSVSPTASGGFRGSRSLFNGSPSSQRTKFIGDDERGISLEIGKFVALITVSGIHFRRQHWCILSLILLIIIVCVAIGLPMSDNESGPMRFIPPSTEKERLELVSTILSETPLIDGHNDLPWNIRKFIHNKLNLVNFTDDLTQISPWKNSDWSHTDLKRLKAGNIGAQFWVAYAPCGSQHKDSVQITLEQIDLIKRFINQYPTILQFVNDSQALIDAHSEGRIASLISVESGHAIGTSLGVLRMFQRLGAISMTLTHNCNTPWADCSKVDKADGVPEHNGLTSFGKIVISEMNRLGMIIDLSHSSRQTALDTIAASEAPVIFSHSSAYFLCNSTRNVPDDILQAVARKNGLVMVNFFSYFLTCSNISSIDDVVAHINHIRKVAGIDHVGIGASYDGINYPPTGLEDVSKYPYLFSSLLSSGSWTPEDLKKLAGLNFIRVFQEIEKVSHKMRVTELPSEDVIDGKYIKDHTNCKTVAKRDANSTNC